MIYNQLSVNDLVEIKYMMNFLFKLVLLLVVVACSPKPELSGKSQVSMLTPKSDSSLRKKTNAGRGLQKLGASYSSGSLQDVNNIDCYAVAVSYEGERKGICKHETKIFNNIQVVSQTVPDGAEILVDGVDMGNARKFLVIGFELQDVDAQCPEFKTLKFSDFKTMGVPTIVASGTFDILDEINQITMTVSMTDAQELSSCENQPFTWQMAGKFDHGTFGTAVFGP